jgi:hypothetical protein
MPSTSLVETQPLIVSATKYNNSEERPLTKSLKKLGIPLFMRTSNAESLTKVYNEAIDQAIKENRDSLVLVHDDVHINYDFLPRLSELFEDYDLIGVAGTSSIKLEPPALWHIMGGGHGSPNLHGAVAHGTPNYMHMTAFGQYPHRVVMVDGVFMAMTRKVFENVRFDESNPSKFHFYDLSFSLDTHKKGYRVGVGDIPIVHESMGLSQITPEWEIGQTWFLNKYGA